MGHVQLVDPIPFFAPVLATPVCGGVKMPLHGFPLVRLRGILRAARLVIAIVTLFGLTGVLATVQAAPANQGGGPRRNALSDEVRGLPQSATPRAAGS